MIDNSWQKDYLDLSKVIQKSHLDENSSLKKLFNVIGKKKTVIDFGCATGYMAQILSKREGRVTGVEINQKAVKIANDNHLIKQLQKQKNIDTLQLIVRELPTSLENQYLLLKQNYAQRTSCANNDQTSSQQLQVKLQPYQANSEKLQDKLVHNYFKLTSQITLKKKNIL